MGNGLYADKLSYKDWVQFNLSQRSHKNFVEQITIISFLLLTAGVVYPIWTLVLGGIYIIGRLIYVIGYRRSAKSRSFGGMTLNLSLFALIALDIAAISTWIAATPF